MKNVSIVLTISLLMLFSCTSEVSVDKDAETKAIQNVVESFFVSLGDFDADGMKSYVTEDFIAFDMAKIMNIDEMVSAIIAFKEMGMSDIQFTIEPVKTEIYGNNAHFCYINSGTGKMGDQAIKLDFIESCLFEKGEEGWKIKFLHSTEVPPPAPEPEMETE